MCIQETVRFILSVIAVTASNYPPDTSSWAPTFLAFDWSVSVTCGEWRVLIGRCVSARTNSPLPHQNLATPGVFSQSNAWKQIPWCAVANGWANSWSLTASSDGVCVYWVYRLLLPFSCVRSSAITFHLETRPVWQYPTYLHLENQLQRLTEKLRPGI